MTDWATSNLALRTARDEMNEAQRLVADPVAELGSGTAFADLGLPDAGALRDEAHAWVAAGMPPRRMVMCPVVGDCSCTPGVICRSNAACPRSIKVTRQ